MHSSDLTIHDEVEKGHDQKNWTPFEFQDIMYYVNSIWPFQVINVTINARKGWVGTGKMITNIAFHNVRNHWNFGHIRGGTPALPIGNNSYLAFFHSSQTKLHLQTYCFGAFTFTANVSNDGKPNFRLSGLSKEPIVNRSMYTGNWKEQMGAFAFIDYVVFPMSFFIEDGFIFLLYGWQDKDGILAKLKVDDVLKGLVAIVQD